MKALITINRHIVRANKSQSKDLSKTVDNAAISVKTWLGTIYCKEIEFTGNTKLIQNAKNARCNGATIWIESTFEDLIIDGIKSDRNLFTPTPTT